VDELWVCNVGTIDYLSALALQERICAARQQELVPDVLLLLEHDPPVYTRGRRSVADELTMGADWYAAQGISVIETNRGGKVTYHGPGQLVGYPIVRVDDVVAYVRLLEQALVAALAAEGVGARARADEGPDYTGVWVEDRKIASIGVHVARGVTTHGFAVNVDNDLAPFGWVVACGLPDVTMTSLAVESGGDSRSFGVATGCGNLSPRMVCFRKRAGFALAQALGARQRLVSLDRLESYAASAVLTGAVAADAAVETTASSIA
jgi:lipoyl(octanoyl) transferase